MRQAILPLLVLTVFATAFGVGKPPPLPDPGTEKVSDLFNAYDARMNRLLAEADEAGSAGEYAKAIPLYGEALERDDHQVCRVTPRTYLGVREYVTTRLFSWPAEGRKVYLRLVDPRAEEAFRSALARGDAAALRQVARRWPLSSFGARAHLALGTRALARGDHEVALRHLLEILRLYPEGEIPGMLRADVLARAGLAAAKRGDALLLDEIRDRAKALRGQSIRLAGGERSLDELLGGIAAIPPGAGSPPDWTTLGGSPSRAGGRKGPEGPLVLYWVWPLPAPEETPEPELRGSPLLSIHPLLVNGQIVVPGQEAVYSLALPPADFLPTPKAILELSPSLVWRFPGMWASDLFGDFPASPKPLHATAAEEILVLPFRDPVEDDYEIPSDRETLQALCLSRQGMQLDQRGGNDPTYGKFMLELSLCGSPVMRDGRVWVAATRMAGLVETWVLCFSRGGYGEVLRPVWKTLVCRGVGRRPDPSEEMQGDASSVALRNGVIYVCSNTGGIVSLDAETGEILWAHAYEKAEERIGLLTREMVNLRTWHPGPPMLDDRLLYVAPVDADGLFVLFQRPDLRSGYLEHGRFGRDDIVLGFDPEYLVGVQDGVVFLAGSTRTRNERPLFAVKTAPAFAPSTEGPGDPQRIVWRAPVEEDAPRGRPVLAGGAIYFSTEKGIYRVEAKDGSVTRIAGLWDEEVRQAAEEIKLFGNLAVSGRYVVSASEEAIALFGPVEREAGNR